MVFGPRAYVSAADGSQRQVALMLLLGARIFPSVPPGVSSGRRLGSTDIELCSAVLIIRVSLEVEWADRSSPFFLGERFLIHSASV
jgi:hypothetical protein